MHLHTIPPLKLQANALYKYVHNTQYSVHFYVLCSVHFFARSNRCVSTGQRCLCHPLLPPPARVRRKAESFIKRAVS